MRFIFDTARVAARSTGTFANIRTFIVGVFVIPLLGVAFNVLLGQGIGAPDVRAIALASLSIGVLGIAASTFVAIVAGEHPAIACRRHLQHRVLYPHRNPRIHRHQTLCRSH